MNLDKAAVTKPPPAIAAADTQTKPPDTQPQTLPRLPVSQLPLVWDSIIQGYDSLKIPYIRDQANFWIQSNRRLYVYTEQRTPEWFAVRVNDIDPDVRPPKRLTASTIVAICGVYNKNVKKYVESAEFAEQGKTAWNLLYEMFHGEKQIADFVQNVIMNYGVVHEHRVRNIFTAITGLVVYEVGFVGLDSHTYKSPDLGVSPDGIVPPAIVTLQDGTVISLGCSLLEIKCSPYGLHTKVKPEHLIQIMAQMYVCGITWTWVVYWHQDKVCVILVNFSQEIWNWMERKIKNFTDALEKVKTGDKQKPNWRRTLLASQEYNLDTLIKLDDDYFERSGSATHISQFPNRYTMYTVYKKESTDLKLPLKGKASTSEWVMFNVFDPLNFRIPEFYRMTSVIPASRSFTPVPTSSSLSSVMPPTLSTSIAESIDLNLRGWLSSLPRMCIHSTSTAGPSFSSSQPYSYTLASSSSTMPTAVSSSSSLLPYPDSRWTHLSDLSVRPSSSTHTAVYSSSATSARPSSSMSTAVYSSPDILARPSSSTHTAVYSSSATSARSSSSMSTAVYSSSATSARPSSSTPQKTYKRQTSFAAKDRDPLDLKSLRSGSIPFIDDDDTVVDDDDDDSDTIEYTPILPAVAPIPPAVDEDLDIGVQYITISGIKKRY